MYFLWHCSGPLPCPGTGTGGSGGGGNGIASISHDQPWQCHSIASNNLPIDSACNICHPFTNLPINRSISARYPSASLCSYRFWYQPAGGTHAYDIGYGGGAVVRYKGREKEAFCKIASCVHRLGSFGPSRPFNGLALDWVSFLINCNLNVKLHKLLGSIELFFSF